jgi:transposase
VDSTPQNGQKAGKGCTLAYRKEYERVTRMKSLAERQAVLKMRFEGGMSYREITKKTGLSINTIKSWSRRCRLSNFDISEIAAQEASEGESSSTDRPGVEVVKTLYVVKRRGPKGSDKEMEKRIKQLEMEVRLLRDFLCEEERRSIKRSSTQ